MNPILQTFGRRLRLGVIGGGPGSFIGPVHRTAARLDDRYEIVAAVLSSNPEASRAAAEGIGIPADRAYGDWREMLEREAAREDGIDVVAIMTPNHLHHGPAMAALERGLDVICDKPLTTNLADAIALVRKVKETGLVFCVTYNYSQYPMVRQARGLVRRGVLGDIRQLHLTYVQGWGAALLEGERDGSRWRYDKAKAGDSLVLGDIGSHAYHLGSFVSGLDAVAVMADLGATVPGRESDDYAGLLIEWSNGARGTLWTTSAAAGGEHGLGFRIFGAEGGLEWQQEYPNELHHRRLDGFMQVETRRRHGALMPEADAVTRTEIGHPEGYQEAFANLYRDVADAVVARRTGRPCDPLALDYPTVLDGAKGVKLVEAAVESSRTRAWVDCRLTV